MREITTDKINQSDNQIGTRVGRKAKKNDAILDPKTVQKNMGWVKVGSARLNFILAMFTRSIGYLDDRDTTTIKQKTQNEPFSCRKTPEKTLYPQKRKRTLNRVQINPAQPRDQGSTDKRNAIPCNTPSETKYQQIGRANPLMKALTETQLCTSSLW